MVYKKLGSKGPEVSAICFGCWAIGGFGPYINGWGKVDDNESIAAIRRAIELGINFFDTADVYGCGHSEEILGKALGKDREKVIIATKVGVQWDEEGRIIGCNSKKEYIISACEASLRRLKTDYIDLYQIHWPDPDTPISETMEALISLKQSGKIRYIGVSNYDASQLEEALKYTHIDSLQPLYNMLERENEKLFPLCMKNGIGVIVYSPLAKGILTGKFSIDVKFEDGDHRAKDSRFRGETFKRNLKIVEKLKPIAKELNKTLAQLAIAWVLSHPAVTSAIVGAKKPFQVEENVGGVGWSIPNEVKQNIDEILRETI